MEKESITISHLIHRSRPLTAASSLVVDRPISILKPHSNPDRHHLHPKPYFPTRQDPNPNTLKPFNQPTPLIGTLTLPSFAELSSPIKCNCFQFSDDSATICCDVLDFDPKIICSKIQVLAWNFIPLKCGTKGERSGFLEIIAWDFFNPCTGEVCSLLNSVCSFCLTLGGACDVKDDSKANSLIFGVIESISPVSIVPCASGDSGSRNISGFLVSVLVCQCKFCSSKSLVPKLKDLSEINVIDHCFSKMMIVYFCGLTSSWHPMVSRFIGNIVLFTGLKKKLVYIKKEESQLMYVTTDEVSLHIDKLFNKRGLIHNKDVKGKGECGSYTGVITGFYMQGMVVEFDQDVTLKNVHFVNPRFQWGKMLILGACCRTSVYVESFSPLETGCYLKSHSQSLLQKFIDSLPFSARLWALLVVSCFRKKFGGVLSEKEILGSKHKEGLAQKYASSHLPLSAFQCRQGVMLEFCKHDFCCGAKEAHCGHLRLVLPIANLISYCEASWKEFFDKPKVFSNFVGCTTPKKSLSCGGRTYLQSVKRVLHTEEIGVIVLGKLKFDLDILPFVQFSLSSGRLQLVDATGEVDIMLDLQETWDFDRIFEVAKDFRLIMECTPPKLVDLDSTIYQSLSCRSILSNALPLRKTKMSIYLYHRKSDEDSRTRSLFFDWIENSQELESGKFHLLMLTHKFPAQLKFQGALADRSNMFAEAIVLPWNLLVDGKYGDTVMESFTRPENHLTHKRRKIEQTSVETSNYGLSDSGNGFSGQFSVSNHRVELPCLIAGKCVNSHYTGLLHCTNEHACKLPRRVILEFGPDSFYKYEALKIGRCYLVEHQEGDILCSIKVNYQVSRAKINISSGIHLRHFTLSSIETLQNSDVFPYSNLHSSSDEVMSKGYRQFEIPDLTGNAIYSEIRVFVPLSALNLLDNVTKASPSKEERDIHGDHVGPVINNASENPCSDYPLPVGDLITLRGIIVALHDCNGDVFPSQPRPIHGEGYVPMFLQGNGGVCVHLMVDSQMVRIFCDQSKQTYPVGLGRDAHATFHRILVLSGQNKYMMTPVSFITINDTILKDGHLTDEFNNADSTVGLISVSTPITIPTTLISDAMQLSKPKPMQFRCRVVAVYILVVEKTRTTAVFQSSVPSTFGFPFAGFVMDDGSSSCCCWTDSERAAALLGLEPEEHLLKDSAETFGRSKAGIINQLNQMLERYGRVVVKNYGSVFDSSCQDLVFSVDSDGLISNLDEDHLRSLITNAVFSTSWTIGGSLMDTKASSWLAERLTELDVTVPPLPNIWAMSICRTGVLAEARNIIQGLV
ncbi:cst complex subunit ctc1 [Phtheirospermum japonicum]|uniref:CST complex subunit CTC1 n=1 Tax=Phtheirospermum japonicum TaxID=374723 RepID=A0A830BHZ3_9LAMI|nr:cst complex subunit ctc1 [Phtheirospermum japonicum]